MSRRAGTVVNTRRALGVPTGASAHSVLHVRCYAPLAPAPVVIASVVKSVGVGVVPVVVINWVSVIPIESPMTPAPSKACKEADPGTDSEGEIGAVIPDSGIWVPARPRYDRTSVNHPRIVRRDVNDFGVGRLNDDRRVLRVHGLLWRAVQIARCLRPLAHRLNGIHHIRLLVVVGIP